MKTRILTWSALLLAGSGLIFLGACSTNNSGQVLSEQSSGRQVQVSAGAPTPTAVPELKPMEARPRIYEAERKMASAPPASAAMQTSSAAKGLMTSPMPMPARLVMQEENRERYAHVESSPVKRVAEEPVSTFSIDVDTGAYANVRRFLSQGRLPPHDAVRIEEMINYFAYDYPYPRGDAPFMVNTEIAPAPWNPDSHLLRIGIKGKDLAHDSMPAANLVFLVDVSGSMQSPNKIGLLKAGLNLLVNHLRAQDRVSIVVYASGTGVVLEPTSGDDKDTIRAALESLRAGGSTNGEGGIRLAYAMAQKAFIKGGINRILLATDGDFNVGVTSFEALKNMVEEKRKGGVSLTTLGFGMGNYNDQLMEQLADAGNGNYSYIDSLNEAQKVLVDEMSSTLTTIAKDVKIQIEFNPEVVQEYRLIGYENRTLKREDFSNDKVDAGEIGAGHTVTALYEITLNGKKGRVDPLRYGARAQSDKHANSDELAFIRLRYKAPDGDTSRLIEWPLSRKAVLDDYHAASADFRFAAAVSAFGQQLRGAKYTEAFAYADTLKLAQGALGKDGYGYRNEFLRLVRLAESLTPRPQKPESQGDVILRRK